MITLCSLGFHKYKLIRDTVIHHYLTCEKCGKRTIARVATGGHQPIDKHWLETGEWEPPPMIPKASLKRRR